MNKRAKLHIRSIISCLQTDSDHVSHAYFWLIIPPHRYRHKDDIGFTVIQGFITSSLLFLSWPITIAIDIIAPFSWLNLRVSCCAYSSTPLHRKRKAFVACIMLLVFAHKEHSGNKFQARKAHENTVRHKPGVDSHLPLLSLLTMRYIQLAFCAVHATRWYRNISVTIIVWFFLSFSHDGIMLIQKFHHYNPVKHDCPGSLILLFRHRKSDCIIKIK